MLTDEEKEVWRGFLAAEPGFAGDAIGSAIDGSDPPHILCVTASGKKVGVEVARWGEQEQTSWRKARESFEDSYLRIIESASHARPERIGWVWLHPRDREVKPKDVSQFREELYELLVRENGLSDPEWDQPQGAAVDNFIGFPVLAAYLDSLWVFPRPKYENLAVGRNWISVYTGGGSQAQSWMLRTTADRILAKIKDYENRNLRGPHILDEVHLVCPYSEQEPLDYASSQILGLDPATLASRVARSLANDDLIFNRIFLFNLRRSPKVIQVYSRPNRFAD